MAQDELKKLDSRRIVDQAALIQNIEEIKKTMDQKVKIKNLPNGPYVNGVSLVDSGGEDNIGTIMNKIYNFKEFIKSYNKLTPSSLSAIVPYIKIWKIYENGLEIEIPFNNYYPKSAVEAITSNSSDRGHQANLLNVEFVSQGKDTATMFIYQVKLNIIFDSIQVLFNDNTKYLELFNPPKEQSYKRGDFDDKYYQIKLKFGWKFNGNLPSDLKPTELNEFTESSGTDLFLNYVMHKITINEDGSVNLQIEYVSSLEMQSKNSNKLNVLSDEKLDSLNNNAQSIKTIEENLSDRGLTATPEADENGNITGVKIYDKETNIELKNMSESGELLKYYKEKKNLESSSRDEFLKGLIDNISKQYSDSGMPVLQIDMDFYNTYQDITVNFSKKKPLEKLKAIEQLEKIRKSQTIGSRIILPSLYEVTDIEKFLSEMTTIPTVDPPGEFYNIPFFTFGRLLKSIQSLGSKTGESDFIILASDCNISSFGSDTFVGGKDLETNPDYKIFVDNKLTNKIAVLQNKINKINILEIPIALSTFKYCVYKNITSQNLTKMNLINFLNFLVTDLLNLSVKSSNEDYVPKQNIQFKLNFERIEISKENTFFKVIKANQGSQEILNTTKLSSVKDFFGGSGLTGKIDNIKKNIIIIYSMPTYNTRRADFLKDFDCGIPHFFYGQNKGLINKITFREESMPYAREANIQSQVDRKPWKPGTFLRSKYNVLIEMLGTVNFRVGSMIYISPSFPGVLNYDEPIRYGIGGYFVILSIKTNIESGKYITNLEANWVATGDGKYTDLSHAPFTVIKLAKELSQMKAEEAAYKQAIAEGEAAKREAVGRGPKY